ncbi:hypothetical protein JW877_10280 [bacterium]|nr:hypothetical protein [bacterium]
MNDKVSEGLTILQDTLAGFFEKVVIWLPALLGAIIVMLLGLLMAKVGAALVLKVLRWIKLEKFVEKTPFRRIAKAIGYKKDVLELISKLVYWTILLIFLSASCNIIGLNEVAEVIGSIFRYIPNILAALIILILGAYLANILRETIITLFESAKMPYPKVAGAITQVLIYIIIVIIALDRLRFDTALIASNISIIIGGFALTFALALGLSSTRMVTNMVAMRSIKPMIKVNYKIRVGEITGRVQELTHTGVIMVDQEGNRQYLGADKLMSGFTHIFEKERE